MFLLVPESVALLDVQVGLSPQLVCKICTDYFIDMQTKLLLLSSLFRQSVKSAWLPLPRAIVVRLQVHKTGVVTLTPETAGTVGV